MEKKKEKKSLYDVIGDILEVYIPAGVFIFLFITYTILIFCRYVMRTSIDWMYELNSFAFVWCGIMAASYGSRKLTHVQFTILYDRVSPTAQRIMRLVGNIMIVVLFIIVYPKAAAQLKFMAVRKSSILKLTFDYVYAPFMLYMILTIIHHAVYVVKDIVDMIKRRKGENL